MFLRPKPLRGLFDNVTKLDMAIKRTALDDAEQLYMVYVRNQYVCRATADPLSYTSWEEHGIVDTGKEVAIAFDGNWVASETGKYYLITEDKPWIFWLSLTGDLFARKWDEGNIITLATGVDKICAVRGWKDVATQQNDQGIAVGYIKSGSAYYRNYCIQPDLNLSWEIERPLTTLPGTLLNLEAFITNDYRIGFLAETVDSIHWTITHRNWAGMAIQAEHLDVAIIPSIMNIKVNAIAVNNIEQLNVSLLPNISYLYASTINTITAIENIDNGLGDWGRLITFSTAQQNIGNITVLIIDDVTQLAYAYDTVEFIDTRHFIIHIAAALATGFNNAESTITVKVISSINEAGIVFNEYSSTFLPVNLVPEAVAIPTVLEVWNE